MRSIPVDRPAARRSRSSSRSCTTATPKCGSSAARPASSTAASPPSPSNGDAALRRFSRPLRREARAMLVLGIESSCDETAAAVVEHDRARCSPTSCGARSRCTRPTAASSPSSRAAITCAASPRSIREALARAGVAMDDLARHRGHLAAGPLGRAPRRRAGRQRSRVGHRTPAGGVDHLVGHLLAVFLQRPQPPRTRTPPIAGPAYPFVALLASGGHTAIYRVDGPTLRPNPRARRDPRRRRGRSVRQGRQAARPRLSGRPGRRSPRRARRRLALSHSDAHGAARLARVQLLGSQELRRASRRRARASPDRGRTRRPLRRLPARGRRVAGHQKPCARRSREGDDRRARPGASPRTASSARALPSACARGGPDPRGAADRELHRQRGDDRLRRARCASRRASATISRSPPRPVRPCSGSRAKVAARAPR